MSLADIAMGKQPQPLVQPQGMPNALAQAAMQQRLPIQPQGVPQAPQQQPIQPPPPMAQPQTPGKNQGAPQTSSYNGNIAFNGKEMTVKNGQTQDKQGNTYIVSNDGSLVTNAQTRQIVGHVENGNFIPIDAQYLEVLKQHGAVQE